MNPEQFYNRLWQHKEEQPSGSPPPRDAFHRYFLDRLFDPHRNPRGQVALELLTDSPGRLLDVGCWKGDFMAAALAAGKCREAVGVDIVEAGVEWARARGLDARLHNLNDGPLPFPNASFDAVTMLGVLEHLFDPYFAVAEARRVLRAGGCFIVAVPNAASFSNRARILAGRSPVTSLDPGWDGGHLHYFTVHSLRQLVRQAGFVVERIAGTGAKRSLREWWPALLLGQFLFRCHKH